MVYRLLKIWVKAAMWLYAKKLFVLNKDATTIQGPLVLAANHPNSFLDALLLGITMEQPVYFIARGDVFRKKWIAGLLEQLHMLPIFRMRDGKDKLSLNDATFQKSESILKQGKVLLIFVEGICQNQTELLLPLKKGAPRIVYDCWQQQVPVKILPVWLQYSSFNRIGKTIHVRLGTPFGNAITTGIDNAPQAHNLVNDCTKEQLLLLQKRTEFRHNRPGEFMMFALALPAILGAVLHAPLYLPVKWLAAKLNGADVHYDGLVLAFLMITYPFYLFLLAAIVQASFHSITISVVVVIMAMLLARCFIVWKN